MMERSYCQGYLFVKIEGEAYEKRLLSGFLGFVLLICSVSVPLSAYDNAINESDTSSGFLSFPQKGQRKISLSLFYKVLGGVGPFYKKVPSSFFYFLKQGP